MREMTSKEIQQVSLEILKDIHSFCVKNDIKYSLSGGTLLGAIRHNGFIPWDDDIDIQMPRPEYEKFIHSYKSEHGYRLFSREVEGCEDVGIAYARVCEMDKTYVNTGIRPWKNGITGLWVDVLPIDGAPSNQKLAKKHINKMFFLWRMTLYARTKLKMDFSKANSFVVLKTYVKRLLSVFIPKDMVVRYIDKSKEYNYDASNYIASYSVLQYEFREWQLKKEMEDFVLHRFEDAEFLIMSGYEISLSSLYGNYMELPPEDKRVTHSDYGFFWK